MQLDEVIQKYERQIQDAALRVVSLEDELEKQKQNYESVRNILAGLKYSKEKDCQDCQDQQEKAECNDGDKSEGVSGAE